MYKIYINETPLILVDLKDLALIKPKDDKNLVIEYLGKTKLLLQSIDMLEKSDRMDTITIYAEDYPKLVRDFEGLYKIIEAAGGVVFNEQGEILTMYRRDSWDLPKGKIDSGETKPVAAVREVEEETGLTEVILGALLCETYHTYKDGKNRRVLKRTYWYKMTTIQSQVTPQTEEDIEMLLWIKPAVFLATKSPIYNTIREVVVAAIEQ